jgi:ectoine hydroxylase-related dioxygenase (phytanoyl-CoA dioxygenase family)
MGQIIAGTRVTKENGGTEVLPGSHLWPGDERNPNGYPLAYVSMEPGSAFFFLGSVYHGGGANTTEDEMRWIFSTFSCRGWVRQEVQPRLPFSDNRKINS